MRIRQIKPEFWKDGDIAKLPVTTRLAYIGLWGLADDAGWFRLDVPSIALELFGYESRTKREKTVADVVAQLVEAKKVEPHDCGHALIPRFVDHQRFAGETKRVYTILREHRNCPRVPAGMDDPRSDEAPEDDPRGSPRFPDPEQGTGNGSVRKGKGNNDARRRAGETESEFRLRVGVPAFMGGDR